MKYIFSVVLSLILFFSIPITVFAAPYGSGTYGSGTYGSGTSGSSDTSSNSNTISSIVSSVGSTITAFFCTTQSPTSSPTLYEIDVTTNTAKLFFSPAGNPYDSHYIAFGDGKNNEGHGAQFASSQVPGAIVFTVNKLAPNKTYTFKVRGQNSCKPGSWSNDLTIKTQPKGSKALAKFYLKKQTTPIAKKQSVLGFMKQMIPQKATPTLVPKIKAQPAVKGDNEKANVASPQTTSLWDNVTRFFSQFHW